MTFTTKQGCRQTFKIITSSQFLKTSQKQSHSDLQMAMLYFTEQTLPCMILCCFFQFSFRGDICSILIFSYWHVSYYSFTLHNNKNHESKGGRTNQKIKIQNAKQSSYKQKNKTKQNKRIYIQQCQKRKQKVTEYGIVSNVHIKLINHYKSSRQ